MFFLLQTPTPTMPILPLPTVETVTITDFIGQIMSWAPVQFLLTAVVSIAVVGILIRAFRRAIAD